MRTLLLAVVLLCAQHVYACHGIVLVSPSVTTNASGIVINASSDAASCGCGPYWMEVEMSYSMSFTGASPAPSSSAWGTFPWFHSLLNVPGYTAANGWPDACAFEPYTTINIPFSGLCAGSTVYLRMREYVEGSASAGPWTIAASVAVPGPAPVLSGSAYSGRSLICPGDTTFVNVLHNGCSGNYTVSWSPAASVSNPSAFPTVVTPTATTTYTVTFTDVALAQTFTATVTVAVATPLTVTLTSTIASCNDSDAIITSSVSGGVGAYSYLWSTAAVTANLTGVPIGSYTLNVTDSLGCTGTASITVTDSCDYVWPGDANDDAIADVNDILSIGIASSTTGTTRPAATITWIGQWSLNWGPTFLSGTDYKFADCNGDGIIDPNDTAAVILNWGLTHNNRLQQQTATSVDPLIAGNFIPDTVGSQSNGVLRVSLGDVNVPATVYGISFRISYDEAYIDPASIGIDISNTWIGGASNVMGVRKVHLGNGMTDIAITRLNQADTTGMGTLLDIYFTTTDSISGSGQTVNVPIQISDVNLINSLEQGFAVNTFSDTLVITDGFALGTTLPAYNSAMQPYPNPAGNSVIVPLSSGTENVRLTNAVGQDVLPAISNPSTNNVELNLAGLAPGIYFIHVTSNGVSQVHRLVKE